eukprot:s1293_g14.t1
MTSGGEVAMRPSTGALGLSGNERCDREGQRLDVMVPLVTLLSCMVVQRLGIQPCH